VSERALEAATGSTERVGVDQSRRWFPRRSGQEVSWLFLLPALAIYALVVLYPSVAGSYYAFTDWNGLDRTHNFVGLDNFQRLIHDDQALAAIKNTVLLAVAVTFIQNGIGLLLALGVSANIKSRYLLRAFFFAPAVLTPIVVAYLWKYIFSPRGALNDALERIGLESWTRGWLGDSSLALWAVAAVVIWQYAGLSMVIFLAGMESVPQELYEAAEIDGAGAFWRFWNITFPLIAPATTINLVLSTIGGLKLFDHVFALTEGGPGHASETLSTMIYDQGFVFGYFGYSTAVALVLTLIVSALALIQLSFWRAREVVA
jgi:raffinose/stachyose/melibiose transport system permease protein